MFKINIINDKLTITSIRYYRIREFKDYIKLKNRLQMKSTIDKIDADDLIKDLRFEYNENIIYYLKEVWRVYYIHL